jgi:hypothetical protein
MSHYVYLYRDERGHARYVGYGECVTRANAHLIKSHNPKLAEFVLKEKFTIEVAGPFGNKETGLLIETSVMSALKSDFNVVKGQTHARFHPLGVPDDYADRLLLPSLQRQDFITVQNNPLMPVLFVIVGDQDFNDGRIPYDPANPAADDQIQERVEKWWQLSSYIPQWTRTPNESPGLLVGINGRPGSQIVIASLEIDRAAWSNAATYSRGEGKISVPVLPTPKLDAFNLRGRRIDRAAELAFEAFPAGYFILLGIDCKSIGGRRPRKSRIH